MSKLTSPGSRPSLGSCPTDSYPYLMSVAPLKESLTCPAGKNNSKLLIYLLILIFLSLVFLVFSVVVSTYGGVYGNGSRLVQTNDASADIALVIEYASGKKKIAPVVVKKYYKVTNDSFSLKKLLVHDEYASQAVNENSSDINEKCYLVLDNDQLIVVYTGIFRSSKKRFEGVVRCNKDTVVTKMINKDRISLAVSFQKRDLFWKDSLR